MLAARRARDHSLVSGPEPGPLGSQNQDNELETGNCPMKAGILSLFFSAVFTLPKTKE